MINYTRTQKIGAFIAVPGVIAFFAGFFCDDNGFMTVGGLMASIGGGIHGTEWFD